MHSVKVVFAFFLALLPSIAPADGNNSVVAAVDRIANELDARVGFSAYDLETGQRWEYQADQRFALSSTFKTLACAALLHRVDEEEAELNREVSFSEADLVTYSPVTEKFAGRQAMTLSTLCEAAPEKGDRFILENQGGSNAKAGKNNITEYATPHSALRS